LDFPYQYKKLPIMLMDEHFTSKDLAVGLVFKDANVITTLDSPSEGADVVAPEVGTL
jgi:hypothetical protein